MSDEFQFSDLSSRQRALLFRTPLASAPAFFIFLSICISLYADTFMPQTAAVTAGVLLSSAFMLFCTRFAASGCANIFMLTAVLSAALSFCAVYNIDKIIIFPDSISTTGKITYSRQWGRSNAVIIDTKYGKTAAYIKQNETPRDGSKVFLRGAAFDFKRAAKHGDFDEMVYWRARGAVKKLVILEMKETSPPSGIAAWRAMLEKRIESTLPALSAKYMAAFTVGNREKSIEEIHRRAGTSHLLAVSGLHVWIAAGILLFLLRSTTIKFIAVSVCVWLYLLISGLPIGGVRAALMLQLMLLSAAVGRPNEAFNNVSLAGIVLLTINPWNFFDIGFRLSMLCALFIAAAGHFLTGKFQRAFVMPVLIWFVTAPIVTEIFDEAPLAGLALNIIAVPIFGVIFPLLLLLSLPSLIGLPFAHIFAQISEFMLAGFQYFLDCGSYLMGGSVAPHHVFTLISIFLFSAACALRCGSGTKRALFVSLFSIFFNEIITII